MRLIICLLLVLSGRLSAAQTAPTTNKLLWSAEGTTPLKSAFRLWQKNLAATICTAVRARVMGETRLPALWTRDQLWYG